MSTQTASAHYVQHFWSITGPFSRLSPTACHAAAICGDFAKMPPDVKHPEHPNGPYPSAIEEMNMSPELLQRFSLPCDTGIREDFVWMPRQQPAKGSTMHLTWPKSHRTERKFYHVQRSRFAGDPLPRPGTEHVLERGGRDLPYDTADADADHTGRAIELAEGGDMAAAISSFRAATIHTHGR